MTDPFNWSDRREEVTLWNESYGIRTTNENDALRSLTKMNGKTCKSFLLHIFKLRIFSQELENARYVQKRLKYRFIFFAICMEMKE